MKRNTDRFLEPQVYAVWHPDDDIRMVSSSGGAFTLLAESVVRRGGVVFGAAWDAGNQVVIRDVDSMEGLSLLRESKYAAATPGGEYKRARAFLVAGREVLYSGTPCQIAGLYAFLGNRSYPKLTTVDFICHGAPDRRAWNKYVKYLEAKYGDEITDVHFRDKRWGVESNLLLKVALRRRGVQKIISLRENTYYHGFIHNLLARKCCLTCRFNHLPRQADFSLADFRGLGEHVTFSHEVDKVKGFTGVMVNSLKAQAFLQELDLKTWIRRPFGELARSQMLLYGNITAHPKYDDFWRDFERMDYADLARRYLRPSIKYCIYVGLRRILGPMLFLRVGIVYKKLVGKRTTSWRI